MSQKELCQLHVYELKAPDMIHLVECEHLSGHLSAVGQGNPHPIIDLHEC